MDPQRDDFLVVGAVEDADAAALGQRLRGAPQEVVVEFLGGWLLNENTWTPCGFTPDITCSIAESFPAAFMACRTRGPCSGRSPRAAPVRRRAPRSRSRRRPSPAARARPPRGHRSPGRRSNRVLVGDARRLAGFHDELFEESGLRVHWSSFCLRCEDGANQPERVWPAGRLAHVLEARCGAGDFTIRDVVRIPPGRARVCPPYAPGGPHQYRAEPGVDAAVPRAAWCQGRNTAVTSRAWRACPPPCHR